MIHAVRVGQLLDYTNTIGLWRFDLTDNDQTQAYYWTLLDAVEQARAANMSDTLRYYYVMAHGQLRRLLASIVDEVPEKIRIKTTEYGKPYLVDYPNWAFNISHSANILLIAIGQNCQLGVDIERCKPRINLSALAHKCFAPEELRYWLQLPEAEKTLAFYRFWTRKEAFVKATGRGIALGLDKCVINPENQCEFLTIPVDYGHISTWKIEVIEVELNWCAALVTDKKNATVQLMTFST